LSGLIEAKESGEKLNVVAESRLGLPSKGDRSIEAPVGKRAVPGATKLSFPQAFHNTGNFI
jgi:hypothetical protein